ncbi:tauropine dehydrogenase-like [Actinia tenebrosa]|uniref:Tauropine dehydrogenase-like n=1 Tax=Actinia tenebrosa TaxID=6105 RepID=A0A6P8IBZ7_ACTTE|nr:tauropine dehydrogenase-like [Actinia tenebrosa]
MSTKPIKLVLCGGGNAAHAWAGIASSQPDTDVCVLSLFQDEAERWSNSLKEHDFTVNLYRKGEYYKKLKAKPRLVTKKPKEAIPGCDVIAFVLPAFAHEQYLNAIKPHLEPGMILVGFPGQSGFEFQERAILGDIAKQITLINFESLPWATRIMEFGKDCEVLGTKDTMMGSVQIGSVTPRRDPFTVVQKLIGEKPALITKGHPLAANLMSVNAYLHTSLTYNEWCTWDGTPLDKQPLFYHGVTEGAAALLGSLSDEVVQIAKAIQAQSPDTDMSEVIDMHTYYKARYPDDIEDKTSLLSCIRTNAAYKGLTHPMMETKEGKFVPNYANYRFLTEDIPFGLVVIRGIAEVVGVATPNIDKVLTWCQEQINKGYLVDGKIQGKDVKDTRAPQRYGFTTLKDIIGH